MLLAWGRKPQAKKVKYNPRCFRINVASVAVSTASQPEAVSTASQPEWRSAQHPSQAVSTASQPQAVSTASQPSKAVGIASQPE